MKYIKSYLYLCSSIIIIPFNIASEVIRKSISLVIGFGESIHNHLFKGLFSDYKNIFLNLYLNFSNILKDRPVNQIEILFPYINPIIPKILSIAGGFTSKVKDFDEKIIYEVITKDNNLLEEISPELPEDNIFVNKALKFILKYAIKFSIKFTNQLSHDKGKTTILGKIARFAEQLILTPIILVVPVIFRLAVIATKLVYNLYIKSLDLLGVIKNSFKNVISNFQDILAEKSISLKDLLFPVHKGKDYNIKSLFTATRISTSKTKANKTKLEQEASVSDSNEQTAIIQNEGLSALVKASSPITFISTLKTAEELIIIDEKLPYLEIVGALSNAIARKDEFLEADRETRKELFNKFIKKLFDKIIGFYNATKNLKPLSDKIEVLENGYDDSKIREDNDRSVKTMETTAIAIVEDLATTGFVIAAATTEERQGYFAAIKTCRNQIKESNLLLTA